MPQSANSSRGKSFKAFQLVVATAVVMLFLQNIPVSNIPGSYAVECRQTFPDIKHSTLYDFVMLSGTANKWMKFVTFVATDHKPVGVGKTYKVVLDSNIFVFKVNEHQQGQYLALQNSKRNDLLNLHIEIRFTNTLCKLPVQYVFPTENSTRSAESTLKNTSWEMLQHNHLSTRQCGSELSLNLYSLHDSFLFQNTIGALFRYFLSRRLDRSLSNLAHILPHVQRIVS
ncbi:uncharacterized protein LOC126561206 [Anopheles maculipalpis]|uniref:uncharacterized protein LOC126561206 n=1 Tax=Anopheles maculipalpis TaxID=1496333 RepID=UPI0021591A4F|nr:uncharacterized protein LOC126561206 [Anopheles maculipalpis]